jgi:uncharacterized protein YdeI (YjbR/CyaY-like superfamily)
MKKPDNLPVLPFKSVRAWEVWLAKQKPSSNGVWVKFAKKNNATPSVSKPEAIESALCFGWIDGQLGSFDDDWFVTRFTPRTPRSKWSEINRKTAMRLIKEGRMRPSGLAEVERAKADGRWDAAYGSASTIKVPSDLTAAFRANPKAAAFFTTLDSTNRYAVLYRIHDAKKPETRAARIEKFVAMLARGEKIHEK